MIATVPDEIKANGLYAISFTARAIQVSRTTVYKMIEDGRLVAKTRAVTFQKVITGSSIIDAITKIQ